MRRAFKLVWVFWWAGFIGGCAKEDEELDFQSCDCGNQTIATITNQTGEIRFHDELGKYVIYRHVPNTIDSSDNYFLCQVPEAFQEVGLQVRFSGEAKDPCTIPTVLTGGQQFYDIRLTKLQKE